MLFRRAAERSGRHGAAGGGFQKAGEERWVGGA